MLTGEYWQHHAQSWWLERADGENADFLIINRREYVGGPPIYEVSGSELLGTLPTLEAAKAFYLLMRSTGDYT